MKLALLFAASLALISAWAWSVHPDGRPLAGQRADLVSMSPALVLSALAGLCSGLARREGLRSGGDGYSSPLGAWIGKRLVLAGLLVAASWISAPLPFPGTVLWGTASALAAGLRLYAGHLPGRL